MEGANVIGADTLIQGAIEGQGSLLVAGRVRGSITLEGDLEVAAGAEIEGEVSVDVGRISGRHQGDLRATGEVILEAGASVSGDLEAPTIRISPDATLCGHIQMTLDLPRNPGAAGRRR